jgi:hypothetical protein
MPQIKVTGVSPFALSHIITNLRPEDREEIEAVRGKGFDRLRMSMELCQLAATHDGWIFWNGATDEPIAALGAWAMTPKVAGCWAFGTVDWPLAVKAVTKHVRKIMIPGLLQAGFHRAECRALASREDTERWLTGLGWRAEAVLVGFGVRREDFTLFAWIANEQPADHPQEPSGESAISLR